MDLFVQFMMDAGTCRCTVMAGPLTVALTACLAVARLVVAVRGRTVREEDDHDAC